MRARTTREIKMADVEEPMDLSAVPEDGTAFKPPETSKPTKKPTHELPW